MTDKPRHQIYETELRDQMAFKAFSLMLEKDYCVPIEVLKMFGGAGKTRGDCLADAAYSYADAMMARRNKEYGAQTKDK